MISCVTSAKNFSVRMRFKIILLTLFALIAGCKSKRIVTEKELSIRDSVTTVRVVDTVADIIRQTDTVYIKVKDAQANRVTIEDPCDSLTGLLREFEIRAGNTTISGRGGSLNINTECDSIIEKYSSMNKSRKNLLIKIRELESRLAEKTVSEVKEEKTGIVGWLQKWKIGIGWFVAGVVISSLFWFIMRFTGRV